MKADVVCLQEIRIQDHQLTPIMRNPPGFHAHWFPAERPGYAGTAILSRREPDRIREGMGFEEADCEGRVLSADFGRFTAISLYLPSGSSSEKAQAKKYRFMDELYIWLEKRRKSRRNVLVCGDWNIAHAEQDLRNWKSNQKNSGFLPKERKWMSSIFVKSSWKDVYRELYPDSTHECYTWWSNRGRAWENNVGWRLDYIAATPGLAKRAQKAQIWKESRFSDHAPLIVDFDGSLMPAQRPFGL
jgi:exodeoxyribonuclease-3